MHIGRKVAAGLIVAASIGVAVFAYYAFPANGDSAASTQQTEVSQVSDYSAAGNAKVVAQEGRVIWT